MNAPPANRQQPRQMTIARRLSVASGAIVLGCIALLVGDYLIAVVRAPGEAERVKELEAQVKSDAGVADPLLQFGDSQILGPDAVDRRKNASKDMVVAREAPASPHRDEVRRLFDDAAECRVAALVPAQGTGGFVGGIETAFTTNGALLQASQ